MAFNYQTYKKIKEHYRDNIAVFRNLGNDKISFDENDGRFKSQGNLARTFSFNNEGTTATNKEGFIYPIVSLCYEACRKGIKVHNEQLGYLSDIDKIIDALDRLQRTYAKQQTGLFKKDKTAQISNVTLAIDICNDFKKILQSKTPENFKECYRKANLLFAQKTDFRSTSNYLSVVECTRVDHEINRLIGEGVYIPEQIQDQSRSILNRDFLWMVSKISKKIYSLKYSEFNPGKKDYTNSIDYKKPVDYRKELNRLKNGYQCHYADGSWQYYQGEDEDVENVDAKGDFLYFEASGRRYKTCITDRLYLNVKQSWHSHKEVVKEILHMLSKSETMSVISDFKITHLAEKRNDTVCIYGRDYESLRKLGVALSKNANITKHIDPVTANMQKILYPGIGMGAEPISLHLNPDTNKNAWSYGSYQSFLVAWGVLRGRQQGILTRSENYSEEILFHVSQVFFENGIDIQKGHKIHLDHRDSQIAEFINASVSYQDLIDAKRNRRK